ARAVGTVTTGLSSLGPALQPARGDAAAALGRSARTAGSAQAGRLRALLVGAELAGSILLLVGTAVLTRSFVRLLQVDVGARTDKGLVARLDLSLGRTLRDPEQRARGQARVARRRAPRGGAPAPLCTSPPPNGRMVHLPPKAAPGIQSVVSEYAPTAAPATPGFFAALGIPLIEGRVFEEGD